MSYVFHSNKKYWWIQEQNTAIRTPDKNAEIAEKTAFNNKSTYLTSARK